VTFRLAIFDFDGTLADSFPFFLEVYGTLAEAHGFRRLSTTELDTLRGYEARKMMEHVGLPLWKMPRVALHFKALMAQNTHRIALFDGTGDMLRRLHARGVTLAIVTSNSIDNVRAILGPEHSALVTHFGCGASLFGKRRKFRALVARSGFRKTEALCIGDEVRDIEAARAEGLPVAAVAWGYTRPDALAAHAPDALFDDLDTLARYFD
jgi:phosphoglycolate phosphatase